MSMIVNKNSVLHAACLLGAVLAFASNADARFLHDDATEIDREEFLSSETYNDEISYRFPRRWQEFWDLSTIGYRVNAGSYNVTRFMFLEDIKVTTDKSRPVSFGFTQMRDEDMIEQRLESEVRVSFNYMPGRFAILGDGSTFKQYGDIGLGFTYERDQNLSMEFQYWSVDHYYNTKKEFPIDSYTKKPITYVLLLNWEFTGAARLKYRLDYDTPTRWQRLSQGYYYNYSRTTHDIQLRIGDKRGFNFNIDTNFDAKLEDKERTTAVGNYHKSLDRHVNTMEIYGIYSPVLGRDATAGIIYITRDAKYDYPRDINVTPDLVGEPYSPTSSREEMVYYTTYYHPFTGASFFQYGLYINDVLRKEVGSADDQKTEIKFQFAWDFQMDKYASVFLNTTWDIDQLQHDFPYKTAAFKPWGGGNIQFVAVF